jgi:hypothetical protein
MATTSAIRQPILRFFMKRFLPERHFLDKTPPG